MLFFICQSIEADSWIDPTWEKMISESDAITLVEYVSSGDFRAKAKVLKIYKGKVNSDLIWISGFSNRFGPIDKVKIGDKFIVFLIKNDSYERNIEYWKKEIKKDKKLISYVNALKKGNAYYVWSPTSGDLRINSKKVQYDLLQTTFYENQKFYSLKEFEQFLTSFKKNKKNFHKRTIKKLSNNLSNDKTSQLLMMLYLSSYKKYNSIYTNIYKTNVVNSHYALAKLLGNVKGEYSRDLLVKLLDNENSIVQGEAVRQLSNKDTDFIGPILLSKLSIAGEKGIYPQDIMNPVQNTIDGGKIEIIKTLGKLKYKPAIPKLLPLLETNNEYLFLTTFEALNELGTKDYIAYLNKHLENDKTELIFEICNLIIDNNLKECIPSLMSYIKNHDKNTHPSNEFIISSCCGLANFDNETVREFLIQDFNDVIKMKKGGIIDNKKKWLEEYISSFNDLAILEVKPKIYNALFDYYGINHSFKINPNLFIQKNKIEQLALKKIKKALGSQKYKKINFLTLSDAFDREIDSINVKVSIVIETEKKGWENLNPFFEDIKDKLIKVGLKEDNLSITAGNVTHSFGGITHPSFSDYLMLEFLKYLSSNPDDKDLIFLQNLSKFGYAKSDYSKEKLNKAIEAIKTKLK